MTNWKENVKQLAGDKKKSKKWLWIGIGVLIVVAMAGSSMTKALEVDTTAVTQEDVKATVWEKGKLKSSDAREIYSEVPGKVLKIYVDTGDQITKGTRLALLDVSEIDAQIARLQGELKAVEGLSGAQSTGQQHRLAVEQAKLALSLAQENYDRVKELHEVGAATKVELDQAQAEVDTKRKAVAQAEAGLSALNQQNKGQTESLLAQLDYLKLQKTKATITADRDGLVFTKKVKEGDMASPGMHLFTIGNKGKVEVETYVNNKDIAFVQVGDLVTVVFKVPGDDIEVPGKINSIAPSAEEVISSLGIAEDKIKVKVDLQEQPKGVNVTPGMSVDVVITTQAVKGVSAVPKEAVFADAVKEFAWVVRDGRAVLVEVETGLEGDALLEIKKGLKQGDEVLINPHLPELKEGIKVK